MKDMKLLGILNIVWGLMGITGGVIGGFILLLPAILARAGYLDRVTGQEAHTVMTVLGIIAGVVIFVAMVVSLPSLIGGIGLLKGKDWARTAVLIVSFFNLLAFPLGTALGAYGIYMLWEQPGVNREARPGAQANPASQPTTN